MKKNSQFFSSNQSCQQLNSAKPQHFHEFLALKKKWQFFSSNHSCQELWSTKPRHFDEFFSTQRKFDIFSHFFASQTIVDLSVTQEVISSTKAKSAGVRARARARAPFKSDWDSASSPTTKISWKKVKFYVVFNLQKIKCFIKIYS